MYIVATDEAAIDRAIGRADEESWKEFTIGAGEGDEWRAVFYKPSGKHGEWRDPWK